MSASTIAAERRAAWPVRVVRLGEEPPDDLLTRTTAAERLAMVEELSGAAHRLAGFPAPDLPRAIWPVRKTPLPGSDVRRP